MIWLDLRGFRASDTGAAAPPLRTLAAPVRWECVCGHVTETVDDVGRVTGVQCGCSREMRRVSP